MGIDVGFEIVQLVPLRKMLKINYFPLRARAEAAKMILSYANIPFEINCVQFSDWPVVKESKEICPFGQIPTMELPNKKLICQSGAITRYCAKLANLYPADIDEAADADVIYELSQEMNLINPVLQYFQRDSEHWQKQHDVFFNSLACWMTAAEKMLGEKLFFGGDKPHFGDFGLFHICECILLVEPNSLTPYPVIVNWISRIQSLPELQHFFMTRPAEYGVPGSFINPRKE